MDIEGKTAIITGASGTLGVPIAEELAKKGCNCVLQYNQNFAKISNFLEKFGKTGTKLQTIQTDLLTPDNAKLLFSQSQTTSPAQILINAAGIFERCKLEDVTPENLERTLNINFCSAVMAAKYFAQNLKDKMSKSSQTQYSQPVGKIINFVGIAAQTPWANYTAYSASKAALAAATVSLAKELAPQILVNALSPGIIEPAEDSFNQNQIDKQLKKIPQKRFGKISEIVKTVIFLIENDYITGQNLNIDGGRSV
jgi:pteridine reductase